MVDNKDTALSELNVALAEVEALKAKVARLEAALKRSEAHADELGRDNYEGDRY